MARPRIFISSTYYDLKHLRSSLENFVDSLGYESILSEKGNIAYTPEIPLDESCYREVQNADLFILIIGGRYGSETSKHQKKPNRGFFERYESITKSEYASAILRDIPTYILIESNVHSEYQTFLKNKDNEDIVYAHVDSVNVFYLIEHILSQPRNNPIHTFERFSDIEFWLKEQWAGLFKELLHRLSSQQQIATLSSEVTTLNEINKTLKTYLEAIVFKVSPENAAGLIKTEAQRLKEAIQVNELRKNPFIRHLRDEFNISFNTIFKAIYESKKYDDIVQKMIDEVDDDDQKKHLYSLINRIDAQKDINAAREILEVKPFLLRRRRLTP